MPRPPIPADVTRAAAILLLNSLAKGYSNVRLEVADVISRRLSTGPPLADVPLYGTFLHSVSPSLHMRPCMIVSSVCVSSV